ncbi:hypothetical protein NFI96_001120, partial [Prochilodus magdalenae]
MNGYGNSIDDEFEGCRDEMYNRIRQLLSDELRSNGNFTNTWTKAKQDLLLGRKKDSDLKAEELRKVAIRAYTGNHIYRELNDRMREGRDTYDQFGLKSLHFLITHDIQTLNPSGTCQTTYRRTTSEISITDTFVRFGSFASSSLNSSLLIFGRETCFIITTCYGAQLDRPEHEEFEVLIPPYEVFIQDSKEDPKYKIKLCDHVYRLKSVVFKIVVNRIQSQVQRVLEKTDMD